MLLLENRDAITAIEKGLYHTLKPKSIHKYLGLEKSAEELCCALILKYFEKNGIKCLEGNAFTFEGLISTLGVIPKYQKMIRFFLTVLINKEKIVKNKDQFAFTSFEAINPEHALKKIFGMYPKFYPFFAFVEYCAENYSAVLSGKVSGVNILFPSGDSSQLERIYKATPQIGHEQLYLNLLREAVLHLIKDRPDTRVIEVGGGQGILTDVILPVLSANIAKYYFTDIGKAFIQQAEMKYRHVQKGLMEFAVFDVTNPADKQGLEFNSFDLLVGFNVLHATKDVGQSLSNVYQLLKPNGYILLIENIKQQIWIDMIYGLTDGWWAFDDGIREISPLLTHQQWNSLLGKIGYKSFTVFPENNPELDFIDTGLIVVQKKYLIMK